jgi:hypothetical protein
MGHLRQAGPARVRTRAVIVVEACVETLREALDAEAGGAHRIELCANLDADGLPVTYGCRRPGRGRRGSTS